MRIALTLEYLGTDFAGWQRQDHAPSVQAALESALSQVANEPITVQCAGRTDKGVHGAHQVVHFDTQAKRTEREWRLGAHSVLPASIRIKSVLPVNEDFHARFSAVHRRYRYLMAHGYPQPAILNKQVSWTWHTLDPQSMHQAAQCLVGEHDFTSFRASECQAHSPVRTVTDICISTVQPGLICLDIGANAFLHHMVRNIMGSLMLIGNGKQPPEWLSTVLATRDRTLAGPTAPATGLYLVDVTYPDWPALSSPHLGPFFVSL